MHLCFFYAPLEPHGEILRHTGAMKTVGFVLLWLVGSGTAVAVAWQGVNIVDNQVINPPHATLATPSTQGDPETGFAGASPDAPTETSEVSSAGIGSDGPSVGSDSTGTESAPLTPGPNASTTRDPQAVTDDEQATPQPTKRPAPTPRPTGTPGSGGAAPQPTPRPSATTTPSPTPDASATTTAEPSPSEGPSPSSSPTEEEGEPKTITFELIGGITSIYFSSASVDVLWAEAKPGYTVQIGQRGSNGVRVEFEGEDGRSRLDASWNGSAEWDISED